MKTIIIVIYALLNVTLYSQLNQQWESIYNGPAENEDLPVCIAEDNLGNIYTAGHSRGINTGNSDIALIKYNQSGVQEWIKRYNGPENNSDAPYQIAVDNNNDIYVAGHSSGYPLLIKYKGDGTELFVLKLPNGGAFRNIKIDNVGNIYVSGYHVDSIILFKFAPAGTLLWRKNYRYPGSQNLIGNNMGELEISDNSNIYLYGRTFVSGSNGDALLIKTDNQGNLLWQKAYNSIYNQLDYFTSVAVSHDNFIYAVGNLADSQSINRGLIIKYDMAGNILWTSIKREYSIYEAGLDKINNLYVSAYIYKSSTERGAGIIKYNKNGNVVWDNYYNPGTGIGISVKDMIINDCNGIYISYLVFKQNELSYSGISKYNTNGHSLWNHRKNGIVFDTALGTGNHIMLRGDYNNIFAATSGVCNPRLNDFHTIRYNETHHTISGLVTFKDNNQPVQSGYVKALYYDESTAGIITIDSAKIQPDGRYTLTKIPQDSLDLMFYQDDDIQQFVPTYYVSTIDWREATKIYATQNLTNINCQVYRITGSSNPYSISGFANQNPGNGNLIGLTDVIIYAKIGNEFKNFGISSSNGSYNVTKLGSGNYSLIAHRIGFEPVYLNTIVTNNNITNLDFSFVNPIGISDPFTPVPAKYSLTQNFPNPFNPSTTFEFSIPTEGISKLLVYDILGREIVTLLNQSLKPGTYRVNWNASGQPSGVYFYRLESGSFTETKKMVLLK